MGASPSIISGPQSVVHKEADAEGRKGDIRRFVGTADALVSTFDPAILTLYDNFQEAVKKAPNNACLGVRAGEEYKWETYAQVNEKALAAGAGLRHLGAVPKSRIGIFSNNVPEWTITAQSCNAYNLTSVALYSTLGPDAIVYIVNQAEIALVVVHADNLHSCLEVASRCPTMKTLVSIGDVPEDKAKAAKDAGIKVLSFADLIKLGKDNKSDPTPPTPDDISFMCYTSGTTGDPKGVMLSHGNMIADLAGAFKGGLTLDFGTEVHVSYLPLAHVFERIVQEAILHYAGAIGFFGGDILKLMDDVAILRPTIFASVPRLFNRLYDKVTAAVEAKGGIGAALFGQALAAKKEGLKDGYLTHGLWDRLVFGKVRARLGGRVKYMVTGSAPLSGEVIEFLRCCFSCPVLEGYGQTECAAACTLTARNDYALGHVGAPLACNEICLESVPDMDYLVTDKPHPRGEVLVRGPNVMKGYFKMPDKTAETVDADGWLHTGDVGMWLPNGTLKIIDRKKNLFKLSQGEYVAPEKIENVYARSHFAAQVFVHGNSLKASILAVIVPDFEVVTPWCKANGKADIAENKEAICKDADINKLIMADCTKIGKEAGLHGFEQIRALILHPVAFELLDCLTPTFKLKRNVAAQVFAHQIEEVYKDLQ